MLPLSDSNPTRHRPWVTWTLVALNLAAFAIQLVQPDQVAFLREFGVVPRRFTDPDWGRSVGLDPMGLYAFITSMFLHGGFLHIGFNLWTLWIFGDNVEDRMGPVKYLAFYLLCGLAADAAHVVSSPASQVTTIGASGAISGVMGAYLVLFPRARIHTLVFLGWIVTTMDLPAVAFLVLWFVIQVLSGVADFFARGADVGGVAFWAHIGGFVVGAAVVRFFLRGDEPKPPWPPWRSRPRRPPDRRVELVDPDDEWPPDRWTPRGGRW